MKPYTYNYIDTINRGNNSVTGFKAQEIGSVIPRSTSVNTEYIPNIYKNCNILSNSGSFVITISSVSTYGLSVGNRNYLQGLNLIGLRRANFENKDILGLSEAYKEIFATKNLTENLNKLNGAFKENPLVKNVIEFINKDKKRSICTPFS